MISSVGKSIGNTNNASIKGDVSAALTAAAGATSYIPVAGNLISTGLKEGGVIAKDAKNGNTAGVSNLTPAAEGIKTKDSTNSKIQQLLNGDSG